MSITGGLAPTAAGRGPCARAALAAQLGLLAILPALAATPVAPGARGGIEASAEAASADEAPEPVDIGASSAGGSERDRPTSTESGQSPLQDSFAARTHAEWVRETRRQAWRDTRFEAQVRTYYLERDRFDESESEAWALGGWLGLKTGYFRERFALGATAYTSQRLHGPRNKDGTILLKPGQQGYSVLGELYGELLLDDATRLTVGRRGYDTPYLNRNDTRMSPNTFEAIALQGLYGGGGKPEWRAGAGYFDAIKQRNSDEFESMATVAGAPGGVERGVYVAGANYSLDDFSIGAIDYYSDDIINIFYAEAKLALPLGERLRLQLALQYADQRSTGGELLRGTDFAADQWGGKAELAAGGALLTAAYTSAGGDTDMQSPWGAQPGYTGVQVEDFNRDGEEAFMLRAAYEFQTAPGLGVYALWVRGSQPENVGQYARDEVDLNLQWAPAGGRLKGLMVRLRYARVSQDDPGDSGLDDLRVMVYFDPSSP